MNSVPELIQAVETAGGRFIVDGDRLGIVPKQAAVPVIDALREHKRELIDIVKARGGRVATFPHCPKCASYALYRRNNIGTYECMTCGLQDIEESTARRVQ
jgi:Zn ribbon nucleic-acid-binding protein